MNPQTFPITVYCPTLNGSCFSWPVCSPQQAAPQAQAQTIFPTLPVASCIPSLSCISTIVQCGAGAQQAAPQAQAQTAFPSLLGGCITVATVCPPPPTWPLCGTAQGSQQATTGPVTITLDASCSPYTIDSTCNCVTVSAIGPTIFLCGATSQQAQAQTVFPTIPCPTISSSCPTIFPPCNAGQGGAPQAQAQTSTPPNTLGACTITSFGPGCGVTGPPTCPPSSITICPTSFPLCGIGQPGGSGSQAQAQTVFPTIPCIPPTIPNCIPTLVGCGPQQGGGQPAQAQTIFPSIPFCIPTIPFCIPTVAICGAQQGGQPAQAQTVFPTIPCPTIVPPCGPAQSSQQQATPQTPQATTGPVTPQTLSGPCGVTVLNPMCGFTMPASNCPPTSNFSCPTVLMCYATQQAGSSPQAQFPTLPVVSCIPTAKCIPTIVQCVAGGQPAQAQTIFPTALGCFPTILPPCNTGQGGGQSAQAQTVFPTVPGCLPPTIPNCFPTISGCGEQQGGGQQAQAQFPTLPVVSCIPTAKCIPTIVQCVAGGQPAQAQTVFPTFPACPPPTILPPCNSGQGGGQPAQAQTIFPTALGCFPTIPGCIPTLTGCGPQQGGGQSAQAQTVIPTFFPPCPTIAPLCNQAQGSQQATTGPVTITMDVSCGSSTIGPMCGVSMPVCGPTAFVCGPTILICGAAAQPAQAQTVFPTVPCPTIPCLPPTLFSSCGAGQQGGQPAQAQTVFPTISPICPPTVNMQCNTLSTQGCPPTMSMMTCP